MKTKERAAREYEDVRDGTASMYDADIFSPKQIREAFLAGVEWAKNEGIRRVAKKPRRGFVVTAADFQMIGEDEYEKEEN